MFLSSIGGFNQFTQSLDGLLHETPGDSGGGSDTGSAGAAPTAAATPAAATPAASSPAGATSSAPAAASPTTGDQGREGWVPSYRIRETREAAQREAMAAYAQREAQIRAEADRYRQQLHAIVGVQPPQNPEVEAVRNQFGQLYPGLSKIEERANEILGILERAGDLESQSEHYWQSYGRQSMDRLFSHAQESLGAPLTDEAKRALHSSFVGFVQSSPEMTARYAEDPTLVEDFWKAFSSSFIDPARRAASATVQGRAGVAVPQDIPGGAPRATPPPKPADLDERAANAWAQYQQTKRS